jgi:S1-C subfamily serine protease
MISSRVARVWSVVVLALAAVACAFLRAPTPVPTPGGMGAPNSGMSPVALGPANQVEAQVEAVYRQAAPAVVYITSIIAPGSSSVPAGPQQITGSGFIFDTQGHVVTSYHVVENAESVTVALLGGQVYTATVLATDYLTDMAVLHVSAPNLPAPLILGDSYQLRVGQFLIAIGNPFGLQHTVTLGIVSALQRVIRSPAGHFIGHSIQTDAAINPGNSGGPLLDLAGQVMGMTSQIQSATGADVGISFAIASCCVSMVVPELIASGHYPHPWMGVSLMDLSAQAAAKFKQAGMPVPVETGLLILEVVPGSPAAQAGLRGGSRVVNIEGTDSALGGDIITAINGQVMTSEEQLVLYLESETHVGDTVQVAFLREGKEMNVSVTLGDLPRQ